VDGIEGDIEEERLVLAALNERHGLTRKGVGEAFLLIGDGLAVAD
jgi:hypothetical protein